MMRMSRLSVLAALVPLCWANPGTAGPLGLGAEGVTYADGTLQTTADPRRAFYLSQSQVAGDGPRQACAAGFHFASLFELLDVSHLRYAIEETDAFRRADSGSGPPTMRYGWIRTGSEGNPGLADPGFANCAESLSGPDLAWRVVSPSESGTIVRLQGVWNSTSSMLGWLGPWEASVAGCDTLQAVWCIQD